jgi:hypothetical protein
MINKKREIEAWPSQHLLGQILQNKKLLAIILEKYPQKIRDNTRNSLR